MANILSPQVAAEQPLAATWQSRLFRSTLNNRSLAIGLLIITSLGIVALLAPWLAPHDPYLQNTANRMVPPFWHETGSWTHR
ncbi:hypothetical protein HORIV_08230 [Vreelandella olivaria]|uniref:Oligopeptide transport permease C-like N-terminal domain-containing protein n=1 Tax=Vreelandella olivaria TaxID=390919 RepID=A0ABM7GDF0_9GAMM|nr:hypothetical protein HORIV_08230 [Halomonas olivaria]